MSWMQKLAKTYDRNTANIGYADDQNARPLLPICHVTAEANIEVVLDRKGKFRQANIIQKKDATTIIPSTEGSAGRAGSKPVNHPLCDKLQYIAGDFIEFGGSVTSGFKKDTEEPYKNFVKSLSDWCNSGYSHLKARIVLDYVKQKSLIADLVNEKVLLVSEAGKLLKKDEVERDKNTFDIFSVIKEQDTAFIRWLVELPGDNEPRLWRDKSLWDSWIDYYLSTRETGTICYVTGEKSISTSNHPKYIRRPGDGAKIISSNDTTDYTFRGRFDTDREACSVSLKVSQKAHYALLWLISRQGYTQGDLAVVAWAPTGFPVPQPLIDTFDFLGGSASYSDEAPSANTAQAVALQFKKRISGYSSALGDLEEVIVIGLDSATTGRLAITYYRELKGSDYLERVENWHNTCSWLLTDAKNIMDPETGTSKWKRISFVGAPAPNAIAEAAYGPRLDDKLRKATVSRILPCIVDGLPIPRDLVESVVRRASNRVGIKNQDDKYENDWNKTLSIACALYRKFNRKENYTMALDLERSTRDYLYGRLLALADNIESWALGEAGESRTTNAARLMQRFSQRPYSTWRNIELALAPYKARLGGKAGSRLQMIDEVIAAFSPDDFMSDRPLSGEFLLGYHSQREYFRSKSQSNQINEEDEN